MDKHKIPTEIPTGIMPKLRQRNGQSCTGLFSAQNIGNNGIQRLGKRRNEEKMGAKG